MNKEKRAIEEGVKHGSSSNGKMSGSNGANDGSGGGGEHDGASSHSSESPRQVVNRQKSMRTSFNGPCVVCLKPYPSSHANLKRLRESLRSSLLGRFPTGQKAVEFSRNLQEDWEPLKFNVTDLHFVSRTESPRELASGDDDDEMGGRPQTDRGGGVPQSRSAAAGL